MDKNYTELNYGVYLKFNLVKEEIIPIAVRTGIRIVAGRGGLYLYHEAPYLYMYQILC